MSIREQAISAKRAARALAPLGRDKKDRALRGIASRLRQNVSAIGEANARDLEAARVQGISAALLDRLRMDAKVVEQTAQGVEHIASLADPIGSRASMQRLPNGLLAGRQRIPLGVIAMVYESRPNVTVDAAALCLKAGNAVLLRGGKDASHSNELLGRLLQDAIGEAGLPREAIQIIPAGDREGIRELVSLSDLIDLAIPRGGEGLIRFVAENAKVPVIKHYKGVCHLFLDQDCDAAMAEALTVNSKVPRPGTCNSLECLLVHEGCAERVLPALGKRLLAEGVELRGCERTLALVPGAKPAAEDDYGREFLDKILAVRVLSGLDAALEHVARYGSNHTEAICTNTLASSERWLREVDASCVLINAATRFNDGGQLGLGAEIGISTSKLHAYGPMGLESLTSEKWVVIGDGQVRS